ncbi:Threonylcarbamoyl-AMP synthase [uncultured archaeon]|nr:Threonylcarbamoyl-AMP synthase [uncultured archaeon]
MRVYSRKDIDKTVIEEIAKGAVFIYPTDTIYGIGCDATNDKAVKRVRKLKKRTANPFSVIAPSIDWIKENCTLTNNAKAWLLKLPGPYTLIINLKKTNAICPQTNMGLKNLGIRIPDHWISDLAAKVGKPIVTTSVNIEGKPFATRLEQLEKFDADFIIYEGEKTGIPSTIVDTVSGKIIKR